PPLSKALWKGEPEEKIWRKTAATGAELHLGRRIGGLDLAAHQATDDQGTKYGFRKLLLATGGAPRRLPLETDQIIYFRTLDDYQRLLAPQHKRAHETRGADALIHGVRDASKVRNRRQCTHRQGEQAQSVQREADARYTRSM